MLHKLKDYTGAFCGPTAVAVITGKPIARVLDEFRIVMYPRKRKPPPIKGVYGNQAVRVLNRLGWKVVAAYHPAGDPTLAAWLRERKGIETTATFLLSIGGQTNGHMIAVRGRKTADSFSKGEPIFIGKSPHRRKRVKRVYRVERITKKGAPL